MMHCPVFGILISLWALAVSSGIAAEQPPTRGQIQDRNGTPLALTIKGKRHYPLVEAAAHVTGYASLKANHTVTRGITGLEKTLDARLAQGTDVKLTIDKDLQSAVYKALSKKIKRGAAVVLDVTNGEVLALVSVPSFDPNLLHPLLPREEFAKIRGNNGAPLLNRTVHAEYPPGSTFKVITALAALRTHHEGNYRCDARIQIDGRNFYCWNRKGHGNLGLQNALKVSCNCYFYQVALDIKGPALHQTASVFGLGQQTGIEFPHEKSGSLDKPERWTGHALANAAIGQGELLVTPLQMARATAAIANGGILRDPKLVLNTDRENERARRENAAPNQPGQRLAEIGINEEMLKIVRSGMRAAVADQDGTAAAANSKKLDIAAKTGTAQWKPRRRVVWCLGFAPYEAPKYAVVVMVEGDQDEQITGGKTACPLVSEILHAAIR